MRKLNFLLAGNIPNFAINNLKKQESYSIFCMK